MHPSLVLLELAAAVMLLLWAVRMVRTGVERANMAALKNALRGARGGRLRAALSGTALAVLLQSSTAVGVLAAGFVQSGMLTTPLGIAALLGADLGSALVVRVLSFDLDWLIPVLLVAGTTLFLKFQTRRVRQVGRIALGIAFILLSLKMIGETTAPLRESTLLPQIITYLQSDPVSAFGFAALFTWLVHSSVAVILLLATFAGLGMLPLDVAIPMVLGANVGGGLIAVWLTRSMGPSARRITAANLMMRATVALIGLGMAVSVTVPLDLLGSDPARQLVHFHVALNAALVVVGLPFVGLLARLTEALIPDPDATDAQALARPASALDRAVLDAPRQALASAARECLRMGETVETMLRPIMDMFDGTTKAERDLIRQLDEDVSQAHSDIKLFIAEINRSRLSQDEARRGIELTDFAINMGHVSDIIARTLLPLVVEKKAKNLQFSGEGWAEMTALHSRVTANLQLALNVLISGDQDSARQLVEEKERMRKLERDSHERHLRRLQSGKSESIETSDMHLEAVRALKEINSLLATVAYPILRQSGDLLDSRLTPSPEPDAPASMS